MAFETSVHVLTGVSLMATIVSPALRPARAPGASGVVSEPVWVVSMHGDTAARVLVVCGIPNPMTMMAKRTNAKTRFMNGPPNMMMMRFQTGSR